MNLLIVGGAGYIGSHIVLGALERGYVTTVFDDLSTGYVKNINDDVKFVHGSTLSISDLSDLFESNSFDCVIHLAASKAAGESMLHPSKYATNNIIGSLNLINFCINHKIKSFIFSSSAAVYGVPEYTPIDESHPLVPTNYYGYTKLMIENTEPVVYKVLESVVAASALGRHRHLRPAHHTRRVEYTVWALMEAEHAA